MPGYLCRLAGESGETERLICPTCRLLLRDPVQCTTTGERYCRSCLNQDEEKDSRPDKAIYKESMELQVLCKQCRWRGPLKFIEEHLKSCQRILELEQENQILTQENQMLREALSELQQDLKVQNAAGMFTSTGAYPSFHNHYEEESESHTQLETPVAETYIINIKRHMEQPAPAPHTGPSATASNGADFDEGIASVRSSAQAMRKKLDAQKEKILHSAVDTELLTKQSNSFVTQLSLLNGQSIASGIESFDKGGERERGGCSICYENFKDYSVVGKPLNGSAMQCFWRITGVAEILANPSKYPLLVSPPWFTDPIGYCFRALIFPNGYEHCCGKYLSIFMASVPGPHDDRLPWSFTGRQTVALLDPDKNARPFVKLFECTHPFEKPSSLTYDPNTAIATGCSDFISHDELLSGRFTKNDTVVLEFKFSPHVKRSI